MDVINTVSLLSIIRGDIPLCEYLSESVGIPGRVRLMVVSTWKCVNGSGDT